MPNVYFLVGLGVLGFVIYFAIARLIKAQSVPTKELQSVANERDRLMDELRLERDLSKAHVADIARLSEKVQTLAKLEHALVDAKQQATQAEISARSAQQSLVDREAALKRLNDLVVKSDEERDQLRVELGKLGREHAGAVANLAHSTRANEEMKTFIAEAKTKLSTAFTELAGQTFEKTVKSSADQSKSDIELLLKPFAERVGQFRERVEVLYSEEARDRSALLGAVTELKSLNMEMAGQANELTRALKGSSKVRGDWGELMLENVLRGSGLEEGKHYERQKVSIDDEGKRLQPDIVVRLPDDRRIVVDSKVNLIAWQEAMNADDPDLHQDAMRRHTVALKKHVKDLGERNYPKEVGESALEITIAFVPIEGALSAALGSDDSLQTFAFDRKVVFASPNTLMAVLRVVERLWTRDKVQRQALNISEAGGRVLDALTSFLTDFDQVGKRLNDASDSFNSARNRLTESKHAVVPRARRLVELGASGKRALSDELKPDSPNLLDLQGDD